MGLSRRSQDKNSGTKSPEMEASLPKRIKFFRVEWSISCALFHQVKCINCEKDVMKGDSNTTK